jgi:pilus assembly protein CpaB
MRGKSVALLMLALGCGLIASLGITQVMSRRPPDPQDGPVVCVAAQDMSPGETVTAQMVKLQSWPIDKIPLPLGAIVKLEEAEGRQPQQKIFAGDLLLDKKLYARGVTQQMADSLIPKGYRTMAVKVDDISTAGGLVMPGSRVDIQVFLQRNPDNGVPVTTVRTLLQGVKVFAVNDVTTADPAKGDKSIHATTVTFLVTPSQGEKLHLASNLGTIRLALRTPAEENIANTKGEQPQDLFRTDNSRPDAPTVDADKERMQKELESLRAKLTRRATGGIVAVEPENEHWRIRCLGPGQISDVEMERPIPEHATTGGSTALWKVTSVVRTGVPEADKGPKIAKEPAPSELPSAAAAGNDPTPNDKKQKDLNPAAKRLLDLLK